MVPEFSKGFTACIKKISNYFFPKKNYKDSYYWKKPVFKSSFIQYCSSKYWSIERWEEEINMLKDIGITEIILQFIVDTKEKYSVYFSEIAGFTHSDVDMLERALSAADKEGIKVRVGLGISDEWWSKSTKRSWLKTEAELNKAIVAEVAGKYGYHSSFSGWYIPYEFYQFSAYTKKQYAYLNSFYKEIATEIKDKLPRDIMIAPYYYGKFPWMMYLRRFTTMLQYVLKDTGVETVALQDGIGAKFNSIKQLPKIFDRVKKTLDEIGIKFYVYVETFTTTYSGFISSSQRKIEEQLIIAKPYAQGFVAFSINYYQSRNQLKQIGNYNDYYKYYIENK